MPQKPDYGIDAPGVIRNLLVICGRSESPLHSAQDHRFFGYTHPTADRSAKLSINRRHLMDQGVKFSSAQTEITAYHLDA